MSLIEWLMQSAPGPDLSRHRWQDDAACKGVPSDLFFPDNPVTAADPEHRKAVEAYCHRCPVIDACYREAVETSWIQGWWGGMSEVELENARLARRKGRPFGRPLSVSADP